ncbi:zinc finger BED domain-containing protein 4-like [Ornithodoros turicata]|uniref:zinc finger BED domain-containing protein 4-like n=1 Tax=Ornithodoros turicata TaxID=34597 RepID=UPI0031393E0A
MSDKSDDSAPAQPPKRAKSLVWDYLAKISSTNASCNACSSTLKTPTGSTTALVRHLNAHPVAIVEYRKKSGDSIRSAKQPRITDILKQNEPLPASKVKALNRKVAELIALDYQPLSIVADRGFSALTKEAVPNYELPSRTTVSRTLIPRIYDDTGKRVDSELRAAMDGVVCSFAFTSDMWTSRANDSSISLTCHFLTPDFAMKRYLLNVRHFPEKHTGNNIAAALNSLCEEWGILNEKYKLYIVTDNGRNIRAAVKKLKLSERSCFAHTLQLAIHDAKQECSTLSTLCKKGRSIFGHYKHSSAAQKRLHDMLLQMKKPDLHVVQDVDTRWNSQYLMLSTLLELKEAITVELATSDADIECFSSSDWREVADFVEMLKPLYDATTLLSGEKYATLPSQIPIIHGLLECLSQQKHKSIFAGICARAITARFPQYDLDETAAMSMFLDPRYKGAVYITSTHKLTWIKDAVQHHHHHRCDALLMEDISELPTSVPRPSTSSSQGVWEVFDKPASNVPASGRLPIEKEMSDYCEEGLLPRQKDPLQWWKCTERVTQVPATFKAGQGILSHTGHLCSK